MKKLTMLFLAFLPLTLFATPVPTVSADGDNQSDHMVLDGSVPEHGYCGVEQKKAEPWELHVSAAAAGTLTITFRDGTAVPFPVAAGTSFSLTQAFGGVPGVDDLVRIDITGGAAIVSARVRSGARDPFTEPGPAEKDNFCVNIPEEGLTDTIGYSGPVAPAFDATSNNLLD